MNANELAKLLEVDSWYKLVTREEIATMLRQQQNRIDVLEANHKIQLNINEKALQYIEQLEQGLKASINLNKALSERKNECPPTSWWKGDPTCGGITENYGLGKAQEK